MNKDRVITFDGIVSSELDIYVSSCVTDIPFKNEIKGEVPYKNGRYNFSTVIGHSIYPERDLYYTFDIIGDDSKDVESTRRIIESWLMTPIESELYDSSIQGYHFRAECVNCSVISDEYGDACSLTAHFKAYPFKVSNELASEKDWDSFCFLTDSLNDLSSITVPANSSLTTYIYVHGQGTPELLVSANQKVTINIGECEATVNPGEQIQSGLIITPGNNEITIVNNNQVDLVINLNYYEEVV